MRIGLLLDPYGEDTPAGLGRYVYEFAKSLIVHSSEDVFTLFTRSDTKVTLTKKIERVTILPTTRLWLTKGTLMDESLDCHIFFTPIIPILFRPKRLIVCAPDFAYLELPQRTWKQKMNACALKLLHRRALKKADVVVAITQATKDSLLQHFPLTPDKIVVIHLGYIVQNEEPVSIEVPEKYFLFAGVFKERKNVQRVIEAFNIFSKTHPEYHLVLTGKKKGNYYDLLVEQVVHSNLTDRVHFLGYVSDGELAYLYQHTQALVFPSLIEGFGMPVLEAMHAGTPVITSDRGALAEVAGGAALLANPFEVESIAKAMKRLVEEPGISDSLIIEGHKRAQQFGWDKSAYELMTLIHLNK